MKKTLIGILFLSLTSMLQAQVKSYLQDTRFGVKVGGNYVAVRNVNANSEKRIGLKTGIFAEIPISYQDTYYIQPELSYSQKGEKDGSKGHLYMDYIDFPIYFKAYFSERESDFFGMIGPRFSYLVSKSAEGLTYNEEKAKITKYNNFDFGLSAGVGYSYKRKWEATVSVDYGFSKVIEIQNKNQSNNIALANLSLSYIF